MSLQVWLPLNGDLHNQGLADIIVINNGATVNNSGKIGSCYSFDGTDDYISLTSSVLYDVIKGGTMPFSIAMWVYHADATRGILFGDYNLSGAINFNIELTAGHALRFYWAGSPDKNFTITVDASQWTHICLVYDGTQVLAYKNGIIQSDKYTGILATKTKTAGAYYLGRDSRTGTTAFNGKLNDFRIYDHALSAKEVEEIAKGLVLHYKLDDIYSESTTNLITTVDGLSNTCYNGAINKYNYGTTTDMYKTTGTFQGKFCTKVYMGTAGNNAYPYIYFGPFNAKGTEIQTVSFDYYPTIQNTLIPYSHNGTYNFNYTSNGVSGSATNVSQIIIPVNVGQWNHITITAQKYDTTNTSRGIGYVRIGSAAHTSTTTDYWLFANVQVEAKDHATGYAGVGGSRVATTIYDSSGYGNNGIIAGNLTTDNNSIRYGATTVFPSGGYIRVENRPAACLPKDAITVNLWQYSTSWSNPISCTEGGGWNFENSSGIRFPVYISGVGYKVAQSSITPASLNNAWHMLTGTMDKNNIKIYIDGEEAGTVTTGSTNGIGYANNYLFISGEASGNSVTPANSNYTGKLSDVRIYATALTPEQIKELYNTSMSIDNNGNIHARELVEL